MLHESTLLATIAAAFVFAFLVLLEETADAGGLNDHHRDGVRNDVVQLPRDP